ncbi:MAG: hypothetical protein KF763_15390 [Cyclobacteriaceae bacterium]|nr:hypothetical protein [Cyclobacteriaceae bacterium]
MSSLEFLDTGFDFGLKPDIILLGDLHFGKYFVEGKCVALSFAFDRDPRHAGAIPTNLFFVFQNEIPATKFFESLLLWIEHSDNDAEAVELTFFEDKDGGYTVGISQEKERFMKRMIPYYLVDRVSPMMMLLTQYKKVDVLGRNYLHFKNNYKNSKQISIGYGILASNGTIRYNKKSFSKRNFQFSQDSAINFNHKNQDYEVTQPPRGQKLPKDSLEEIQQRRTKELKSLLPFAWHRLQNDWLKEVRDILKQNHGSELVTQGILNLLVFERIKNNPIWAEKFKQPRNRHAHLLLEYLTTTHESFDSYFPDDAFFDRERIVAQMKLDKNELDEYLNEKQS